MSSSAGRPEDARSGGRDAVEAGRAGKSRRRAKGTGCVCFVAVVDAADLTDAIDLVAIADDDDEAPFVAVADDEQSTVIYDMFFSRVA